MRIPICAWDYDPCTPVAGSTVPVSVYKRIEKAAVVVCVNKDYYSGTCYAFDDRAEAEEFFEKNKGKAEIYYGDKALEYIKDYVEVASDEEVISRALRRITSIVKASMVKPNVTAFLVDASGSMEPAWYEAWSLLFDMIRHQDTAFIILAFKDARRVRTGERPAVVSKGDYHVIIDVARLLKKKNLVRIKRAPLPEEVGLRFEGWTPLLAAITDTIKLVRRNYPNADITVFVVSDNRDSLVAKDMAYRNMYSDSLVVRTKTENNVRLVLVPVGHALMRYTDKYDEIKSPENKVDATSFLTLI